jgi:hypothetical protein
MIPRQSNESSGIGKEDLREVQSRYAQRCGACDLRKRKTQAAPGVGSSWQGWELPCQCSLNSDQWSDKPAHVSKMKLTH